jgi:5-formyltetrahydrofolate cyclo-ligase
VADRKKELREILGASRRAFAGRMPRAFSDHIQEHLLRADFYRGCPRIVLYAPKDGEVSTDRIFEDSLASGKSVYYPRIEPDLRTLSLVRVANSSELKPDAFGILSPDGNEGIGRTELSGSLICVPGVAFTPAGYRLGRGGGFYDRLLNGLDRSAITIGLAYSFQLVDDLPRWNGDQALDFVVTESRVYCARESRERSTLHEAEEVSSKWS